MGLAYNPVILLVGIYSKNPETPIRKNICIPMFRAALFTIPKMWEQLKCLSLNEWMKRLWCTYAAEHYSAVKNEETLRLCNNMDGPGENYAMN